MQVLRVVLAEVDQARPERVEHHVQAEALRHRDQGDRVGVAAGACDAIAQDRDRAAERFAHGSVIQTTIAWRPLSPRARCDQYPGVHAVQSSQGESTTVTSTRSQHVCDPRAQVERG